MSLQRYYMSKTVYTRQDISYFIKYVYELSLTIKSKIFDQQRNVTDRFLTYEKEKSNFILSWIQSQTSPDII